MNFTPRHLLLCTPLFISSVAFADALQSSQYGDFDRYVLALSWQTGFCQSMHDRNRNEPAECKAQQEQADKSDFLTVHGLWPGLPKSVASRGVDEKRWMRYGCATRPVPNMAEARASNKCAAPDTGLSVEMASKLAGVMPGAGGNPALSATNTPSTAFALGLTPTIISARWCA